MVIEMAADGSLPLLRLHVSLAAFLDALVFGPADEVFEGSLDGLDAALASGIAVLAHPARRELLSVLLDSRVGDRRDLAERLARSRTTDCDDAERLEVALHHVHLPKLDEQQYVDYDARSGDVALWEDPGTVEAQLSTK